MTLMQKIKLSDSYGRGIYIVSLIMTLAASALVVYEPEMVPDCIILKILSIPALIYLFEVFRKGLTIYFYLNLGISRIEYYAIPVVVEFAVFVICMIISSSIGYAIGQ